MATWQERQEPVEHRKVQRVGRIGKDKVAYVSLAAYYNYKDGNDWKIDAPRNSVTHLGKFTQQLKAKNRRFYSCSWMISSEQLQNKRQYPFIRCLSLFF
jgi:hypothetical protein